LLLLILLTFSCSGKSNKNAAASKKIAKNGFIPLKELNSPHKGFVITEIIETHLFFRALSRGSNSNSFLTLHSSIFLTHFFIHPLFIFNGIHELKVQGGGANDTDSRSD
jgi:hypothetical protein